MADDIRYRQNAFVSKSNKFRGHGMSETGTEIQEAGRSVCEKIYIQLRAHRTPFRKSSHCTKLGPSDRRPTKTYRSWRSRILDARIHVNILTEFVIRSDAEMRFGALGNACQVTFSRIETIVIRLPRHAQQEEHVVIFEGISAKLRTHARLGCRF